MVQQTEERISTPSSDVAVRTYKGGVLQYYRQPSGEIVLASAAKMDMATRVEMGWAALQKYGVLAADYEAAEHPFAQLFRQGGAKEVPVWQLIEHGFTYPVFGKDRNEYYKVDGVKVEFPQLAGTTIPSLEQCPHCDRTGTHDQIQNHEEVQHQKDMMPVKMARQLGQIFKGEGDTLKAETPQPPNLPFICGVCGQGFTGHMAIARHAKGEHPK